MKPEGETGVEKAMPMAVALDDATVAFRVADARVYTAVEKANLQVADGEFVAIVGPTGCGKSTLLNVAAGLLKPASGTVRIFEQPLAGLNRQAGYLFQADALFPWKTALDNVAIGLEVAGAPRAACAGARARLARLGRSRRLRQSLSAHALGRPAQARWPRAGADPRSRRSC